MLTGEKVSICSMGFDTVGVARGKGFKRESGGRV